jgi:predicted N-acetyltransferase YhbS
MGADSWHGPALMNITIEPLHRHPQLRAAVARLIYDEFWTNDPDASPAWMEGRLSEAADHARLPLSFVALAGGEMVGTINLIDNDDEKRPHLWPWLAALAVVPAWRRLSVGAQLVNELLRVAATFDIDTVYFGTDGPDFYRRLGAVVHEQVTEKFCIMRFDGLRARPK